jgi:hypothetical protein
MFRPLTGHLQAEWAGPSLYPHGYLGDAKISLTGT